MKKIVGSLNWSRNDIPKNFLLKYLVPDECKSVSSF